MHALPQGPVRWRGMYRAGSGQRQEGQGRVRARSVSGPFTPGPSSLYDNGGVSSRNYKNMLRVPQTLPRSKNLFM